MRPTNKESPPIPQEGAPSGNLAGAGQGRLNLEGGKTRGDGGAIERLSRLLLRVRLTFYPRHRGPLDGGI